MCYCVGHKAPLLPREERYLQWRTCGGVQKRANWLTAPLTHTDTADYFNMQNNRVLNFDTSMGHFKLSSCLPEARKTILSTRHYALISLLSENKQFSIFSVLNWQELCWVQYWARENNCQERAVPCLTWQVIIIPTYGGIWHITVNLDLLIFL